MELSCVQCGERRQGSVAHQWDIGVQVVLVFGQRLMLAVSHALLLVRFESVRKIAGEDDALNEDEMQCIERLFKVIPRRLLAGDSM
jgi:hypothetical protein